MKRKIVIAAAVLLVWMAVPAAAAEVGQAQAEALEVESLEQAAEEYTGGLDLTTGTSLDEGLRQILDTGSRPWLTGWARVWAAPAWTRPPWRGPWR